MGKIIDYKTTSAWTTVFQSQIKEWTEQLNCYAYLYRTQGFSVDKLEIIAIYRDWSRTNALKDKNYPNYK